ncbi:MAG TPA: MlaD family protein [Acidimicrobiales bacterium]|nr:MlaD family protein [Acidimicrobiales bacterium]
MSRSLRTVGVLLALATAAAGCSLPGQVEGPVELTALFTDVGDLVSGHSVQVADVRVGSVTGIDLTDDFCAKVTMKIKDDLHLPRDSSAILRTTSLLGEKFIELRAPEEDGTAGTDAARCTGSAPEGEGTDAELADGDTILHTRQAPELEFVAQEAVDVLAGVAANDLAALIETGGIGFGGRAVELTSLIDSLGTVSGSLAEGTEDIVAIIDGLDQATSTLAGADDRVDQLLVNLARTTEVLAANRELTLQTLRDLTRLAGAQNDLVFEPYRADLERQIGQLDAILALVAERRSEVAVLVDWLARFAPRIPLGVPGDFAQVYGWFEIALLEDGQ